MMTPARIALVALLVLGATACSSPEERAAAYVQRAQELLEQGDLEKAKVEARNAIQIEPKNAAARYTLALIAEQKGEAGDMLQNLGIVAEVDPKNAAARIKLGTLLVFAQDYEGAAMLADDATKLTPDDPALRLLKARLLLQKEDVPGALAEMDRAIQLDPKNVEAALLRGLTLAATDREKGLADLTASIERIGPKYAKALRQARITTLAQLDRVDQIEVELKSLIADFPTEDYASRLAALYVAQKRVDDAEQVLQDAVVQNPENTTAKLALAQFQARFLKQPAVAEQTLKKFIAEEPDNLQLPVILGTFYEASNRRDDAIGMYRAVAEKSPLAPEGLAARNRVAALTLVTDGPRGKELLNGILADAPDNGEALLMRADVLQQEGRFDEAIADLRGVLRRTPDSEAALLLLASTHERLGDGALAADAYRRVLQVNPRQPEALVGIALQNAAAGQSDDALRSLQEALAADPASRAALSALVDLQLGRRDLAAAEDAARKLVALGDTNGLGDRQLGRVLEARKQYPAAIEAYGRALAKSPESTLAFEGVMRSWVVAGQPAKASEFARAHLAQFPDHVRARVALADSLASQGKGEEALAEYRKAAADKPDLEEAWLGAAAATPTDPAARVAVLEEGRKKNPKSRAIAMALATEYERGGRADDAVAVYEDVLKADPKFQQGANSLASLLLDARTDEASYKRALELAQPFADSKVPAYLDTLGWAHYRNKDMDAAVRFLEIAVALSRDPPPIVRYHLGLAYRDSGNAEGARQELGKVVKATQEGTSGRQQAEAALAAMASAGG